jgi:hypothetical protein
MSELDDAITRLERAVARLEAAPVPAAAPPTELREAADRAAAESEAASRRLAELSTAQSTEEERVRGLAGMIAARVEAAIGRIERALAEEG